MFSDQIRVGWPENFRFSGQVQVRLPENFRFSGHVQVGLPENIRVFGSGSGRIGSTRTRPETRFFSGSIVCPQLPFIVLFEGWILLNELISLRTNSLTIQKSEYIHFYGCFILQKKLNCKQINCVYIFKKF